jgi:flagellar motor switch protein FliN
MSQEITPQDALVRLGASTAEAIARVLEQFLPDAVERGEVTVHASSTTPFENLPFGAVSASVSYVNGVTGANVFVMTPAGARALVAAMGASEPSRNDQGAELSELELSAVGEAANQMLAAASAAIGVVIGHEIQISPPDTRILDDTDTAIELYGSAPHATSTSFILAGEPCRLIQLVPSAFVVRMVRAIDELSSETTAGHLGSGATTAATDGGSTSLSDALRDINLRVWAELGRTQLTLGDAIELPFGSVVDLDRAADAPVELFVNGLRFGDGHLLVTEDGEWAIRLERVVRPAPRPPTSSSTHHLPNAEEGVN